MALIKKCGTCGTKNDPTRMLCIRCMTNISATTIEDDGSEAIKRDILLLICPDNTQIEISHGDSLGRDGPGSNLLKDNEAIARHHVGFALRDEKWMIKDRGSSFGTLVNGQKMDGSKWHIIRDGDKISISKDLSFTVKI